MTAIISGIPYWRLSSFYFFYFAFVGALTPYLSLYLADIGLAAYAIGLVNAVLMGTKIVAPNFWGWLCDRSGRRLSIITLGSFFAALFFSGLFFWKTLLPILLITFFYSFFWNAILSQFDTLTVQYLEVKSHRYSHIRLWGSIGFIVAVVVLGALFDIAAIAYLIPIAWGLLILILCSCLSIKDPPRLNTASSSIHWLDIVKRPAVIAFFVATFLLQFSFGAYYTFFSLYLENYAYTRTTIGLLWALGVVAEVLLFVMMHKIMPKIGAAYLLFWSLALTALRWLITAFYADNLWVMIIAQCIHAFSFGAAHAACIELIRCFFQGNNAGQGNALYSSVTFGLGGAIGALSSGFLWEFKPQWLFVMSGVLAAIAAAVVFKWLCCRAGF